MLSSMDAFDHRIPLMLELGFREEALVPLRNYIDFLWQTNEELNLISRKMNFAELIDNHLIDCLLPLKHFPTGLTKVADFGSGGGLPGVVYALQFPELSYVLYEKSPKKQDFLKACRKFAPNLDIQAEIPHDLPGVQLVTARAFKPIDVILDISRKYYERGGRYFLLKARREKIDEELTLARKKWKSLDPKIQVLTSPILEVERHLVIL